MVAWKLLQLEFFTCTIVWCLQHELICCWHHQALLPADTEISSLPNFNERVLRVCSNFKSLDVFGRIMIQVKVMFVFTNVVEDEPWLSFVYLLIYLSNALPSSVWTKKTSMAFHGSSLLLFLETRYHNQYANIIATHREAGCVAIESLTPLPHVKTGCWKHLIIVDKYWLRIELRKGLKLTARVCSLEII